MQRILHSLLLLFAFALAIRDAQADIIHVPADQPTIQAGIDAATNGDQVLVAAGSYSGAGNRDLDFGGKAIIVQSAAGPAATTIVCGGSVQDSHRGFRFHLGEGASSVVDGFTIEGGFMPTPNHGGAISCQGSAPTIRNCIFNGNLCSGGSGGAINADGASSPVIEFCSFTANQAEGGGGIAITTGSITGCSFELNAAGDAGAGISAVGVTTISGCTFSRNIEDGVSSHGLALIRNCSFSAQNIGVRVRSGTPVILECTFSNMMVGVACVDFGGTSVTRCYFNDNLTGVGSGAKPFHSPSISESIFTGNEHPIDVSIVGGSLEIRRCTLAAT